MRKRGFTLIEMLITIAVIAILMTITMRITSAGKQDQKRIKTQTRLHCLENCLSGYYAAFGAYPQVKLHGSRDIYRTIDSQTQTQSDKRNDGVIVWEQVEAACRSQPIAARYPFSAKASEENVKPYVKLLKKFANSGKYTLLNDPGWGPIWRKGFDGLSENAVGRFNVDQRKATDWQQTKVFQFGLVSYLLPRYLLMMGGDPELYEQMAQWNGQNKKPHDPLTGGPMKWTKLHDAVKEAIAGGSVASMAKVLNIPSQAVTARWMPNLQGLIVNDSWSLPEQIFGVSISFGTTMPMWILQGSPQTLDVSDIIKASIVIPESGSPYVLDSCTIVDAYGAEPEPYRGKEFYYYSPVPYQTYTIWSAGADGRTFPPWVSLDTIKKDADAIKTVTAWIADDIVRMSR